MDSDYENALRFASQRQYIKSLEIISEAELCGNYSERLNIIQADMFMDLGEESENPYKKLLFFMAATEAYSRNDTYDCVYPLFEISEILGLASIYERVSKTAELFLTHIGSILGPREPNVAEDDAVYAHLFEQRTKLQDLVNVVRERIENPVVPVPLGDFEPEAIEIKTENGANVERLRPHWESSSENTKREFMKVSTHQLRRFVLNKYEKEGKDALEKVLRHVKKNETWIFWLCRSCSQKFSTSEECTSHLEQVHAPSSMNELVEEATEVWADKIAVGVWKDAMELVGSAMESQLTRVKEKINFDSQFTFLLLDKRMLQGDIAERFDDEGKITFADANLHCSRVQGDGAAFLDWLALSGEEKFKFPAAIRTNSMDVWMAALRSFQLVCRTLNHAKKEILVMESSGSVNNKVIPVEAKTLLKHLTDLCSDISSNIWPARPFNRTFKQSESLSTLHPLSTQIISSSEIDDSITSDSPIYNTIQLLAKSRKRIPSSASLVEKEQNRFNKRLLSSHQLS
ncbi:hypothetical protein Bca4012_015991 [Brassica carinata]